MLEINFSSFRRSSRSKNCWSISKTTDHSYHFQFFFVPIHSVRHTLAHVLIHQRKIDTDLQTKLQKPPSCIPQWISIVSSRTQTFNRKENAQHSFTCSFLKRLPLAILRLFQCFYHFLVLHKKKSCISHRVIPLLVQRTGGKENFSLSGFFTCFGRVDDRKVRALTVIMKSWKRAYKDAPQPEVLLFPF